MVIRDLRPVHAPILDDPLTRRSTACAIEVHTQPEPGVLEKLYKVAMVVELQLAGLKVEKNVKIPIEYKGHSIGDYFIDLLVEDCVILELKSVERHDPVFEAQILSYLRLTQRKIGLLINFHSKMVKDGIKRFVL